MAREHHDLLRKATRLTELWREEGYAWISPDELLLVRPMVTPSCRYPFERARQMEFPCSTRHFRISTGEETYLAKFNDQNAMEFMAEAIQMIYPGTAKWKRELIYTPPRFALSPNGRYLLWNKRYNWRVADLEEGKAQEIPGSITLGNMILNTPLNPPVWLPGSQSWLDIKQDFFGMGRIVTRSCDMPEQARIPFILGWKDGLYSGLTESGSLLIHHPDFLGNIGKALLPMKARRLSTHAMFSEMKVSGYVQLARWFKIRLPVAGRVDGHVPVSPEGNQLAWLIQETVVGMYPARYSLWISDLSGKAFQEMGVIEGRSETNEDSPTGRRYSFPHDLQWSPHGRYISFIFGETLFMVPVVNEHSDI